MKKMTLIAALALSFSSLCAQESWNVELIWEYNRGDIRYSGSWSYEAPDGTEYALLGARTGTAVYRLEEPFEEVGFVPGPASNWREITVVGHHAYVVTEGSGAGEGMQVIDLGLLPDSVYLLSTYTATFTTGHIIQRDIYSEAPRVYVCGTTPVGGVHILDVSNPAQPVEIGGYQPGYYIHDCHVRGNRLYAAAFYDKTLDIVDISAPANPLLLTTLPDPGTNTHSCSTSPDEQFLFLADEADGYPGRLFDISDLGNIQQVATYTANPLSLVHNPYIAGDLAFLSHNTEGLRVVDIADPALPVEIGYFDTYAGDSGGFKGLWSACPYFSSGKIIGGDRTRGLMVWAFTGPRAARVYGMVRDSLTGAPLADALVILQPQEDTLAIAADGSFAKGLIPGSYTLQTLRQGYWPKLTPISLAEQENLYIDIDLAPETGTQTWENPTGEENNCRVYPSLFSNVIHVEGDPQDFLIVDIQGHIIHGGRTPSVVQTASWPVGAYVFHLFTEKGELSGSMKLMKK